MINRTEKLKIFCEMNNRITDVARFIRRTISPIGKNFRFNPEGVTIEDFGKRPFTNDTIISVEGHETYYSEASYITVDFPAWFLEASDEQISAIVIESQREKNERAKKIFEDREKEKITLAKASRFKTYKILRKEFNSGKG